MKICIIKNDEILAHYDTIKEASQKTGIDYTGIQRSIRGEQNSAGGFNWKKINECELPVDFIPKYNDFEIREMIGVTDKLSYVKDPVICQVKDDEIIAHFDNMTQASKQTGVDYTGIKRAISGRQKTAGGFEWIRVSKEEFENNE